MSPEPRDLLGDFERGIAAANRLREKSKTSK